MSDWREFYRATVLETNPPEIQRRITETQVVLFLRLLELGTDPEVVDERREIESASKALVTLKQQRAKRSLIFTAVLRVYGAAV
jgi:hypothetical protein